MIPPGETFKLRIFIDKSVVEVFVNGNNALLRYIGLKESVGVSLRAGDEAELKSLDAYQMKSVYD
jgi:beta-fructofuranosidase